jgi:uncharacterized membrane protein
LIVRLSYALLLTGYFGIMLLLPAWYGWLAPPQLIPPKLALLLLGLPLFLPLRGLLHARRYTVAWSLFLSLLYLAHGCMEGYSNAAARWLALAEAGLSLCWIAGGILYLRSTRSPPSASEPADRETDQEQGH